MAALYWTEEGQNEGWHRAVLIEIWDHESVDVFYVDYGTVSRLLIDHCRFLDKRFGQAKAQAIHAKCGGIKPKKSIKGTFLNFSAFFLGTSIGSAIAISP